MSASEMAPAVLAKPCDLRRSDPPSFSAQQLDALEARLMTMVASHIREADRISAMSAQSVDARLDALEQRQTRLEGQMSEVLAQAGAQPPPEQPRVPSEGGTTTAVEEEQQMLELAMRRAEALERRLEDAEAAPAEAAPEPRRRAAAAGPAPAAAAVAPEEEARRRNAEAKRRSSEVAITAMRELEEVLQAEVKSIHQRCGAMQDLLDERTLLPLRELEQRLDEQDLRVRQLTTAGQDCSSRLEEHEFRLGVSRTKLEVHDQKISRLEAMRWQRGSSLSGGGTFSSDAGAACGDRRGGGCGVLGEDGTERRSILGLFGGGGAADANGGKPRPVVVGPAAHGDLAG